MNLLFSGCAGMFDTRTHLDQMERESDGWFSPGKDFSIVPGDKGEAYRSKEEILKRTPASKASRNDVRDTTSLNDELKEKEENLSENEYREYRENEGYFENVSEKIYYLNLPLSERLTYLRSKRMVPSKFNGNGYSSGPLRYDTRHDTPDPVYQGMDKEDVIRAWGRPDRVDIAGNPKYENERWIFLEGNRPKYIYFESGRVNGWAID